jgi:diguanylate cyclase (GGDEF)-like protein/PAS domain S-box-containing protein
MLRVAGCLTQDHDPGLVALAGLICVLAVTASVRLLGVRGGDDRPPSAVRTAAAVLAFSTGAWTTHFISILAFRPTVPFSFNVPFCVLSLCVSIAGTTVGFTIRPGTGGLPRAAIGSGLALAAGIGTMHFVGMHALVMPGTIHYDADLLGASFGLAALGSVAAMWLLGRGSTGWAAVFLTIAVGCAHFIAMGSVTLELVGGTGVAPLPVAKSVLALATGGASILILTLAITASVVDQHFSDRLIMEARRFRLLADATFEGLILEHDGRIIDANRAMCELAGTNAVNLIGRPLSDLIPGLELRQTEGEQPVELAVRQWNGQTISVEALWRQGSDRGGHVVAVRDISREKSVEGQIQRMADFDPLTGLANRELFEQKLDEAIALAEPTSSGVALHYIDLDIDLDRFERADEAFGHLVAEQVLSEAARRLAGAAGKADTVARIGRDEFGIIQSVAEPPPAAAALADRIVTAMAVPFSFDGAPVLLSASVSVVRYPAEGATGRELIDSAMLARISHTDE